MGFDVAQLSQHGAVDQPGHGAEIAVVAAVMEHRQQAALSFGQVDQARRLRHMQRKWLVDDDMLARFQRRHCERVVRIIWRGDHNQVDIRVGQQGARIGCDVDARQIVLDAPGLAAVRTRA